MKNKFYIFGSENSTDYDILVEVDEILPIEKSHDICKLFNVELSKILKDKPINSNLAVIKNDRIVEVFKGTSDELNNVLFYTYDNHEQYFDNPIKEPIIRDIDEKILRVSRFIITFFSRTDLRVLVKSALRGDLKDKLKVLKSLDFVTMNDFSGKKEKIEDIYKVIAFQFGQVFSLIDGYESDSYTKNGVIKNYPDLKNILNRGVMKIEDFKTLNSYLNRFINLLEEKIESGIKLKEK
jgi:hypothetical protein